MATTRKYLLNNEKLYFEAKPHWITLLKSIGPLVLLALFFIFMAGSILDRAPARLTALFNAYQHYIWGVIILIFLFPFVSSLIHYLFTASGISSRRILFKSGLINKELADIPLRNVESCECKQSLLGQMFNYGDIIIRGSGSTSLRLYSIGNPFKFKSYVIAAIEKMQNDEDE